MTRELKTYVVQMRSVHIWQYDVNAYSLADAVRRITRADADSDYGQNEINAWQLPSTAKLVEARPIRFKRNVEQ